LDLDGAIEVAAKNNPILDVASRRIAEARGDVAGASVLLAHNPELEVSAGRRSPAAAGSPSATDIELGVWQRFEIGGQRGDRIDHAQASVRATEATADDVRRVVELAVAIAFYDALAADEQVRIWDEGEKLSATLLEKARLRLERGEGTHLEVNTAIVRHAEVKRRASVARSARDTALLRLRALLGYSAEQPLSLSGNLPVAALGQSLDALVASALETRSDLKAMDWTIAGAKADVALADAQLWPDISLGVFYSQEGDDDLFFAGLSVSLPLFNRNQGERQRTRATVHRVQAERRALHVSVDADVRLAYAEYEQARDALTLYDSEVLEAQEESLVLLERAFEAGEVGYADVVVLQREVLEGRAGYVDARLAYAHARAQLLAAANLTQTDASARGGAK